MLNVEQLKYSVNRMPVERVADAVLELRLEGLVTDDRTPSARCTSIPALPRSKPCSSGPATTVGSMWSGTKGRSTHFTTLAAGSLCRCCAG